eukprot:5326567-Pyramimonas_sp.AAC.1
MPRRLHLAWGIFNLHLLAAPPLLASSGPPLATAALPPTTAWLRLPGFRLQSLASGGVRAGSFEPGE